MAALVAQAGYPLVVIDTDQKLLKEVCQQTGAEALDASKYLADVDVVITMLPNAQAVNNINILVGTYGLAKLLTPDAYVIDMSPSEPSKFQALSRHLAEVGVDWLDAPVFGNVQEALAGTPTILVGGRYEILQRYAQLLSVMGGHVGPDGGGHAVKVLNSYVSAAGVLATIETLQAVEKFGVGCEAMTRVLNSTPGANVITARCVHQFMLSGTNNLSLP